MEMLLQCMETISKVGLGVGAFGLLTWMVVNNTIKEKNGSSI